MRMKTAATALVLACLAQAGCGGEDGGGVAADPARTAPQAVLTPSPDVPGAPDAPGPGSGTPAPTAEPSARPTPEGPVQSMPDLRVAILNEINDSSRHGSPAVKVQRRKWAQYQIIVNWTVSTLAGDPAAPALAREDAVKILQLVQRTNLPVYGSILLIVTGAIPRDADGGKKITRVIRAKYTAAGVRGTTYTPATVWAQADDKKAEIHPVFR